MHQPLLRTVGPLLLVMLLAACDRSSRPTPNLTQNPNPTPPADPVEFTVTAVAGSGGAIEPTSMTLEDGTSTSLNVSAEEGFGIAAVSGCGGSLDGEVYTTGPVTADCTVEATFVINTYTVNASAGDGGSVDPIEQVVEHGTVGVFEVVPDLGYRIENVTGCDGSLENDIYTTGPITAACEISAAFALLILEAPENVVADPGVGQVTLSWDAVEDALEYNLYFGTEPNIHISTAASYDDLLLGVQSPHVVAGLDNGAEYHFVVTAAAGPAESPSSAEVSATPFAGAASTFFGSVASDGRPFSMLVHPINGDVYVLGGISGDAPVTEGAWITNRLNCGPAGNNVCRSALARFTPDLGELIAATYLPPGNPAAILSGMVADPVSGDIFVAGSGALLSGAGLRDEDGQPVIDPDTDSAYVPYQASSGGTDGVLLRLNAALSARLAATNYGGPPTVRFHSLAISPADGDLYVLGDQFGSAGSPAPGTTGGAQESYAGGDNDLLIARFSPQLHDLRQATYLGGSGRDWGAANYDSYPAILVHPDSGDVYVVNSVSSTDFPTTPGALQESVPGTNTNGIVARLSGDLSELLSSTYFGGDNQWAVTSIAVAADGDLYIGGRAIGNSLPGREGGAQPSFPFGAAAGFVSRLSADLTTVRQSSYFGALNSPSGTVQAIKAIQIHPDSDEVYVTGEATVAAELPGIEGALLEAHEGTGTGAFFARFNPELTEILQSTRVTKFDTQRRPVTLQISPNGEWVYTVVGTQDGSSEFSEDGAFPTNPGSRSYLMTRMRSSLAH